MCRINEEMCNEAKHEISIEIAQRLISMGMNTEDIAKVTKLPIEEVQNLSDKVKAS